jgi:uncharacterized glyoxalase superfamily protein PhnB
MATKAKAIPEGYHSLTAYISIRNASEAIAFYKKAFGGIGDQEIPEPERVGVAALHSRSRIALISAELLRGRTPRREAQSASRRAPRRKVACASRP